MAHKIPELTQDLSAILDLLDDVYDSPGEYQDKVERKQIREMPDLSAALQDLFRAHRAGDTESRDRYVAEAVGLLTDDPSSVADNERYDRQFGALCRRWPSLGFALLGLGISARLNGITEWQKADDLDELAAS